MPSRDSATASRPCGADAPATRLPPSSFLPCRPWLHGCLTCARPAATRARSPSRWPTAPGAPSTRRTPRSPARSLPGPPARTLPLRRRALSPRTPRRADHPRVLPLPARRALRRHLGVLCRAAHRGPLRPRGHVRLSARQAGAQAPPSSPRTSSPRKQGARPQPACAG